MTGRERRLLRMLCMTASGGGGGDKPWEEMTWDDVIAATKNGKYKNFEIGAMKELDLGSEGIVHMQIVGIDTDELADGSGYAPLTFISKELLKTRHSINASNTVVGGWEASEMRTYLKETVKHLIPSTIAAQIKAVKKYSYRYDVDIKNAETIDDVWIPSAREVLGGSEYENLGPFYNEIFVNAESRTKADYGSETPFYWRLRSPTAKNRFLALTPNGEPYGMYADSVLGVALGFCL